MEARMKNPPLDRAEIFELFDYAANCANIPVDMEEHLLGTHDAPWVLDFYCARFMKHFEAIRSAASNLWKRIQDAGTVGEQQSLRIGYQRVSWVVAKLIEFRDRPVLPPAKPKPRRVGQVWTSNSGQEFELMCRGHRPGEWIVQYRTGTRACDAGITWDGDMDIPACGHRLVKDVP
jgi:hypothetical protein